MWASAMHSGLAIFLIESKMTENDWKPGEIPVLIPWFVIIIRWKKKQLLKSKKKSIELYGKVQLRWKWSETSDKKYTTATK